MTDTTFIDLTKLTINSNPTKGNIANVDEVDEVEISDNESNKSIISIKKQTSRGDIKRYRQRPLHIRARCNTMESEYIRLRDNISNLQIKIAYYEDIIKHKDTIIIDQRQIIQRQSKEILNKIDELAMLEEKVELLRTNPYTDIIRD